MRKHTNVHTHTNKLKTHTHPYLHVNLTVCIRAQMMFMDKLTDVGLTTNKLTEFPTVLCSLASIQVLYYKYIMCGYIHTHTYIAVVTWHNNVNTHTHTHTNIYMSCACMCVYVGMCVYIYTYTYTYIYIHIYIYISNILKLHLKLTISQRKPKQGPSKSRKWTEMPQREIATSFHQLLLRNSKWLSERDPLHVSDAQFFEFSRFSKFLSFGKTPKNQEVRGEKPESKPFASK